MTSRVSKNPHTSGHTSCIQILIEFLPSESMERSQGIDLTEHIKPRINTQITLNIHIYRYIYYTIHSCIYIFYTFTQFMKLSDAFASEMEIDSLSEPYLL
jgi:hypothetical protein